MASNFGTPGGAAPDCGSDGEEGTGPGDGAPATSLPHAISRWSTYGDRSMKRSMHGTGWSTRAAGVVELY